MIKIYAYMHTYICVVCMSINIILRIAALLFYLHNIASIVSVSSAGKFPFFATHCTAAKFICGEKLFHQQSHDSGRSSLGFQYHSCYAEVFPYSLQVQSFEQQSVQAQN